MQSSAHKRVIGGIRTAAFCHLGPLYHGTKDPEGLLEAQTFDWSRLQSRDSGFFGNGFYLADSPQHARSYGGTVLEVALKPSAKILCAMEPGVFSGMTPTKSPSYQEEFAVFMTGRIVKHRGDIEKAKKIVEGEYTPGGTSFDSIGWKKDITMWVRDEKVADAINWGSETIVLNPQAIASIRRIRYRKTQASAADGIKTGKGKGVGFFIPLPLDEAAKFPSLGDQDKSPSHVTFLYVGDVTPEEEPKLLSVARNVFRSFARGPVRAHSLPVEYFVHPAMGRRVAVVPWQFDKDLAGLRWKLRDALQDAGFKVEDSFPLVYRPHTTLRYCESLQEEYKGSVPVAGWSFDAVEIWGLPYLYRIPFGEGCSVRVAGAPLSFAPAEDKRGKPLSPGDYVQLRGRDGWVAISPNVQGFYYLDEENTGMAPQLVIVTTDWKGAVKTSEVVKTQTVRMSAYKDPPEDVARVLQTLRVKVSRTAQCGGLASRVASRFLEASKSLPMKGRRYGFFIYGDKTGAWELGDSARWGGLEDGAWQAIPSFSSKNEWRNLSVEGATEHHPGFLKALREMVREYPEMTDWWVQFDGPWIEVRDLVGSGSVSPKFNWESLKLYHGTSMAAWEKIQKQGLLPRNLSGMGPSYGTLSQAGEGHKDAVYLTTQIGTARMAARDAARVTKSKPIVLQIRGLDAEFVVADEDSHSANPEVSLQTLGSVAYVAPIPASRVEMFEYLVDSGWTKTARFDPELEGLGGLLRGEPTTLYHGTTRQFKKFDLSKSRTELVNDFYGAGIFLTPSQSVAWDYAEANRNIGLPSSIVQELKRKNPVAGDFLEALVKHGDAAWDIKLPSGRTWAQSFASDELEAGVDPNSISDIAQYVEGSKVHPLADQTGFVNIFSTSTGAPEWLYDLLAEVGLDDKKYRPKVYAVSVKVDKVLVTAKESEAKKAHSRGYDAVIFHGSRLVGGVPEVAVFDPSKVRILNVRTGSLVQRVASRYCEGGLSGK